MKRNHDRRQNGWVSLANLYINGWFATFDELKVCPSHTFSVICRSGIIHNLQSKTWIPTCRMQILWYCSETSWHQTANLIKFVCLLDDYLSTDTKIKDIWTGKLSTELSESMRDKCLSEVASSSVNSRHQLILYKTAHCLHYSKQTAPILSLCLTDMWKGKISESTLSHAFWFCPTQASEDLIFVPTLRKPTWGTACHLRLLASLRGPSCISVAFTGAGSISSQETHIRGMEILLTPFVSGMDNWDVIGYTTGKNSDS